MISPGTSINENLFPVALTFAPKGQKFRRKRTEMLELIYVNTEPMQKGSEGNHNLSTPSHSTELGIPNKQTLSLAVEQTYGHIGVIMYCANSKVTGKAGHTHWDAAHIL